MRRRRSEVRAPKSKEGEFGDAVECVLTWIAGKRSAIEPEQVQVHGPEDGIVEWWKPEDGILE